MSWGKIPPENKSGEERRSVAEKPLKNGLQSFS
jgi:hypothetical protein